MTATVSQHTLFWSTPINQSLTTMKIVAFFKTAPWNFLFLQVLCWIFIIKAFKTHIKPPIQLLMNVKVIIQDTSLWIWIISTFYYISTLAHIIRLCESATRRKIISGFQPSFFNTEIIKKVKSNKFMTRNVSVSSAGQCKILNFNATILPQLSTQNITF